GFETYRSYHHSSLIRGGFRNVAELFPAPNRFGASCPSLGKFRDVSELKSAERRRSAGSGCDPKRFGSIFIHCAWGASVGPGSDPARYCLRSLSSESIRYWPALHLSDRPALKKRSAAALGWIRW